MEMGVMEQRRKFIEAWLQRREPLNVLCEQFGISRKTGHKWTQRFYAGGGPALADRSRRPLQTPHAVSADTADTIVALRKRFPLWGPKKLRAWLYEREPNITWPAASTIGALLKQRGMVKERRRRIRTPIATQPLSTATEPNVLWCTDFKGCFRVGGQYCHPLTISDAHTRFLLCVKAVEGERFELVKPAFESVFREYGMPWRIRSDNGAPFASNAVGGLSRLSVWWVKLGITPERIVPGHPEQNGRHERMHRTLKDQTARPPRPSEAAQQRAFDDFSREYNHERPHEALGQRTPASAYVSSTRRFPDKLADPEYPHAFDVRRLDRFGTLKFRGSHTGLGNVLAHEAVGLEEIGDDRWQLWFGPIYLGTLLATPRHKLELHKNLPARDLPKERASQPGSRRKEKTKSELDQQQPRQAE
jgi:transposase InsO family protein